MIQVSVIITTYNSERFLKRTLDSVFSQTGINEIFEFEVIIIDDKSTDNTKKIIENYNVLFFENEINSGGPNKGRNRALALSTGDYIAFIDHDDEWLTDKTINQLKYIKDTKIITGGYIDIELNHNIQRVFQNNSPSGFLKYNINDTFLNRLQRDKSGQIAYMASIMIHKDLKNILFEEQYGMCDFDWILRIFFNNSSSEITRPVFTRYVDGSNLSLNENYRLNAYQNAMDAIHSYIEYPKQIKIGMKKLNGSLARYYYLIGKTKIARKYLIQSNLTIKNVLYYLTSFIFRKFVIKNFKVFG